VFAEQLIKNMSIERCSGAPLTPKRANELIAGAELVLNGFGKGYCTIREGDSVEDTARLIKEAIKMECERDAQAAERSGRDELVTRGYAAMEVKMLESIEKIHRGFQPSVPIRERVAKLFEGLWRRV
jgi:hypothetical protein